MKSNMSILLVAILLLSGSLTINANFANFLPALPAIPNLPGLPSLPLFSSPPNEQYPPLESVPEIPTPGLACEGASSRQEGICKTQLQCQLEGGLTDGGCLNNLPGMACCLRK